MKHRKIFRFIFIFTLVIGLFSNYHLKIISNKNELSKISLKSNIAHATQSGYSYYTYFGGYSGYSNKMITGTDTKLYYGSDSWARNNLIYLDSNYSYEFDFAYYSGSGQSHATVFSIYYGYTVDSNDVPIDGYSYGKTQAYAAFNNYDATYSCYSANGVYSTTWLNPGYTGYVIYQPFDVI